MALMLTFHRAYRSIVLSSSNTQCNCVHVHVHEESGLSYMKVQKFGAKNATADSCFGLIGPRQCSAALGGPATSTEDLRHQGALNKPGVLKYLWVS